MLEVMTVGKILFYQISHKKSPESLIKPKVFYKKSFQKISLCNVYTRV